MCAPDCKPLRPEITLSFFETPYLLTVVKTKKYQIGIVLFVFNCQERDENKWRPL